MKQYASRLIALLLVFVMVFTLAACGQKAAPEAEQKEPAAETETKPAETEKEKETEEKAEERKPYVIGCAEALANDATNLRRVYFEEFIAPTYNVKFIFSETLLDDAAVKTFVENCIDAGADAIIDFKSGSPAIAQLCEENGLYYTFQGTLAQHPGLEQCKNLTGVVGGSMVSGAEVSGGWLADNLSEDGSEGFIIATGIAAQGQAMNINVSKALLAAIQEKYDLTFEDTLENLVKTPDTMDVANDKGILITLYPGSPSKDTWLPGASSLIQTGNYGAFLSCGNTYNVTATVVDEVERAMNKDIMILSQAALGSTLENTFKTEDAFGKPCIDLAIVRFETTIDAYVFALTYNALNGNIETLWENGMPREYDFAFTGISSVDQMNAMVGWDDVNTENWIANKTFVDRLIVETNPELSPATMDAIMADMSYETVATWMK